MVSRVKDDRDPGLVAVKAGEGSNLVVNYTLDGRNRVLVAPVHRPLLDALGAHEFRRDQDAHVLAQRRGADAELFGDQEATDAVFDQVAVDLRPEMPFRVAK